MNLSLSPRCSTTKLLLPSPLQNRMAMISLRPAEGQGESRNIENKSERVDCFKKVSDEQSSGQNKFNAFRPWQDEAEKEQELKAVSDEYGKY